MGKTKTAIVSGAPEDTKTGQEKYKERQKKKKEAETTKKKKQVKGVGLKGGERIKAVVGEEISEKPKEVEEEKAKKKAREPRARGKKYKDARSKVDKTKLYTVAEAIKLVKETSFTKFDGTVELHIVVKKEGLIVNVELPHSTGKKKRIEIANTETLKKLKKGKVDFDLLLATAEMMPKLVPFAKLLGPKGLMPNPKNGTLIKKASDAKKFSANTQALKTERKAPIIHTTVGKVSQKDKELVENTQAIIEAVNKRQLVKAFLTSTMSPSVKLDIS